MAIDLTISIPPKIDFLQGTLMSAWKQSRLRAVTLACAIVMTAVPAQTLYAEKSITYYYTDPQGTVLATTDAVGNITSIADYRPYGTRVLSEIESGPGYTGHISDPDSGLIYMQARYYDPDIGRFLSNDPVGLQPGDTFGNNNYSYVNNNPVVNWDPTGMCAANAEGSYCPETDSPPPPDPTPPQPKPSPKDATPLSEVRVKPSTSTTSIGIPPPIFRPPEGRAIFRSSILKPIFRKIDDAASNQIVKTLSYKALKITKTGVLKVTPMGAAFEAVTHIDDLGGCDDDGNCRDEAPVSSLRHPSTEPK
ncbi:RHS repeat domain-containing protein [Luteibacter sp. E-22]|uniref:RHS repeat domain-containing protein n=1 Tax=Luteibacter sp. E-22 TaxID=3404050 RepID=UPI003CEC5530